MRSSPAMPRALAALVLVACSAPPAPPPAAPPPAPPLDRDLPRLVERSLALYRDIAAALAITDCPATITRLRALASRDHDVVLANAQLVRDGRTADGSEGLLPGSGGREAAAAAVVNAPAMTACIADPAFTQALDSLFKP